eukprot:GFYU01003441.1.p2 GENE.GFYU01003441.1~~GFYU01003441.1.p2  ORF type:complete len:151 (+),score=58.41 GFYU01003441.1:221-673(+)
MSMLSQAEIDQCTEVFEKFKGENDRIDVWDVKNVMTELGHSPTEEELFQMMTAVDAENAGALDFHGLTKIISLQKTKVATQSDDTDTVDAFVAMGGNNDKSGEIHVDKLRKTIKDFGLTIDIDQLILETDTDGSGFIDYEEFQAMLADDR